MVALLCDVTKSNLHVGLPGTCCGEICPAVDQCVINPQNDVPWLKLRLMSANTTAETKGIG